MHQSLFSSMWYRVAEQHPRLRPEVRVQRQPVRGRRWYLLVDTSSGRQCRLSDGAYEFIGRCDGRHSVQQIWDALLLRHGDDSPTQDEVIRALNQLDQHGLIAYEIAPDSQVLARRHHERKKARGQGFVNPFALRVPIGNPTRYVRRLTGLAWLVFHPVMLCAWIAAMILAGLAAASNWTAIAAHASGSMSTPRYLLLAWLSFPVIKAIHELGHALAVRRWGGNVHEAGFTLFVLVPAPYVDASAANAFRRYQRVVVAAAGIMVELAIAAIALVVWLNVQPGIVRDFAFVTMFIASVSTVIFNGNPLLPFDGYHMLCDALELPNLAGRSRSWWQGVVLGFLRGQRVDRLPVSRGEEKWLFAYAPASFACRVVIAWWLVVWIGSRSATLAAAAALLLVFGLVVRPMAASLKRVAALPSGAGRGRAARVAAAVLVIGAAACAVPFPFHTVASGVVWPSDNARVRAGVDGFVTRVLARDGDRVAAGQVLLELEDPALITLNDRLQRRLEQLHATRFGAVAESAELARRAEEDIARTEDELQRAKEKLALLQVRAQTSGMLVMPHERDLPGTFAQQGSTIGYVLEHADIGIRAAVPEHDAALLRDATYAVDARIAGVAKPLRLDLLGQVPASVYELPSAALGDRGGGPHPTDPADPNGLRTREPVVLVDLRARGESLQSIGARAWVRFDHGVQPLASRWYRQLRQVLLQHFNPAV